MNKSDVELLLKIGAEGGELLIHRYQNEQGKWRYVFTTDESALADFLDQPDPENLKNEFMPVNTFKKALALMNSYPWHHLYLIYVHPKYADIVEEEKLKRLDNKG